MNYAGTKSVDSRTELIVKVCGITNLEDALVSVEAGANALGFNFYPRSPRFIDPLEASKIISQLPVPVLRVAVVVIGSPQQNHRSEEAKPGLSEFREIIGTGVDAVQVHGVDRETEIPNFGIRTIVATSPAGAREFPHHEIIIDSSWGSGQLADWNLILDVLDRPYILSGGLTPENVGEALNMLDPAGVDVCSGVEASPGKKDLAQLERFLSIVGLYRSDSGSDCSSEED